jgi:16S rRNA C967 or C1407 C5-methylase (RsmB/RsmF family)/NOL1/NOP2/fmu family ribosome biogenesis protein
MADYPPLPPAFLERLRRATAVTPLLQGLEEALGGEAAVSLRLHPQKGRLWLGGQDNDFSLAGGLGADTVPWCPAGRYTEGRPLFTADPLFHAGVYYVQESASMFLEQAIGAHLPPATTPPLKVLDLCAAPGGKATHLATLLPHGSLLVANEVVPTRCSVLEENMVKWGYPATVILRNHPAEIARTTIEDPFDLILADVPCSGEGLFRKGRREAAAQWTPDAPAACAARQRRILADIWPALRSGGYLIYSTCTYNTEENEEVVRYLVEELGATPLSIPILPDWGIATELQGGYPLYRFFPHRTRSEGFTLAMLRKGEERDSFSTGTPLRRTNASPEIRRQLARFLLSPDDYAADPFGDGLHAFPAAWADYIRRLSGRLHIYRAGIDLGQLKGRDFVPAHSLAMSVALRPDAFPAVELSGEAAIRYLRKETLALPSDTPRGYVLVRYAGVPLGFVKHLGNRTNNLYPSAWRIRLSAAAVGNPSEKEVTVWGAKLR